MVSKGVKTLLRLPTEGVKTSLNLTTEGVKTPLNLPTEVVKLHSTCMGLSRYICLSRVYMELMVVEGGGGV